MSRTGGCLCGGVTYEITGEVKETGACHCGMCRKSSGGVFLGVRVKARDMTFKNKESLSVYTSSPWAERAFCGRCGSTLFYRITAEGDHQGDYHVGLGTVDDTSGIKLTEEIFIDRKPGGYSFAEQTHKMTEAEVMEMFGAG